MVTVLTSLKSKTALSEESIRSKPII